MDNLLTLSLSISIWFQQLGDWLYPLMKGITFLGNEEFYLFIMPILYWCVDQALGIKIGMLLLMSGGTNFLLKLLFHSPRPYWYSSQVKNIISASSFGFPSGHAQNASSLWGYIAMRTKKRWFRYLLILIILLIGISRIILGVHFAHDVIVGWVTGLIILILFTRWEPSIRSWFLKQSSRRQIFVSFLSSLSWIVFGLILASPFLQGRIPLTWIQNTQGELDPLSLDGIFTISGVWCGLLSGRILLTSQGGFNTEGPLGQLMIRFLIGIFGVVLIWWGLDLSSPESNLSFVLTLRYIRYLCVGLWISFGAPWLFTRLGLAAKKSPGV
ncbi:MAG: phosphatase PAP2 family protein [Anaerolineales bacterium]|nr:phosphatase PAP2 family protein [Anaerolineales bacterium]MBS3752589.1 phosphatase PAP2 family protein [Anaerolineales bacterium]